MKKSILYLLFALLFTASMSTLTSCREDKSAKDKIEEVGEDIEEGVEEVEDEIDDATDDN